MVFVIHIARIEDKKPKSILKGTLVRFFVFTIEACFGISVTSSGARDFDSKRANCQSLDILRRPSIESGSKVLLSLRRIRIPYSLEQRVSSFFLSYPSISLRKRSATLSKICLGKSNSEMYIARAWSEIV